LKKREKMSEKIKNEKIKLQSLSASQRWLNCTASLLYNNKPFVENKNTLTGSLCHKIAELMLRSYFFGEQNYNELMVLRHEPYYNEDHSIEVQCTPQLWSIAENYVKYVKGVVKAYDHPEKKIFIEKKINLKFYGYEKYGFADFVLLTPDVLYIIDLKTGRNEVSADNNSQMLLYTIGLIQEFGARKRNITAISQPILNSVNAYEYTKRQLNAWYKNQAQALYEIAENKLVYRPSEKVCKYCDHRDFCNERIKKGVW